jgi:hypothetical protein
MSRSTFRKKRFGRLASVHASSALVAARRMKEFQSLPKIEQRRRPAAAPHSPRGRGPRHTGRQREVHERQMGTVVSVRAAKPIVQTSTWASWNPFGRPSAISRSVAIVVVSERTRATSAAAGFSDDCRASHESSSTQVGGRARRVHGLMSG